MKHHGWIILDKPLEMGSTQAVGAVKRNLREAGLLGKGKDKLKVGHGGTLDPLASGVLPIALGEATKLCGRMLDARKIYAFTIKFGEETDTLDAEGVVIDTSDVRPKLPDIENILASFTGDIEQIPPKYSALKIDGQRAYDLARAGAEVEMKMRGVTIFDLSIIHPHSDYPDTTERPLSATECHPDTAERHIDITERHPATSPRHPDATKCHPETSERHIDITERHPATSPRHPDATKCHPDATERHPETTARHPGTSERHPETTGDHPETTARHPEFISGSSTIQNKMVNQVQHDKSRGTNRPQDDGSEDISEITLRAHVSKGTYIRSLARDIARKLGSVGHVTMLRRIKAGPFSLEHSISLDKLNEIGQGAPLKDIILPMEAALADTPALYLSSEQAKAIQQGRVLSGVAGDGLHLAWENKTPIALVEISHGDVRVIRGFNIG